MGILGQSLAQYRIVAAIGAGGMGEVFRARDTKLDRDVAIKVLPAELAQDRERLARFEREAKLLASLNHSNIAHVYGFESATLPDGATVHFLAMELVEGEDLAERLKRGAIPVDESIAIAKQIAEGLEEAHEHGIIHRDLKPANIKLTPDGKVKVLDFGLAKALEGDPSDSAANSQLSHSPTMSRHATEAGMILGTAAYMSPEQARGKTVDKRADIWAFGVVLFEMLTGTRLFAGETVSDTLAAVLREEIPWARLPGDTLRSVAQLLRRCLARDPRQRMRDIGDARIGLEGAHDSEADAPIFATRSGVTGSRNPLARWWPTAATALGLAGWAATAVLLRSRAPSPEPELRASLTLPDSVTIPLVLYNGWTSVSNLAISPQGDKVAFVGVKDGRGGAYLRSLDRFEATLLPGSDDAVSIFFSPDGRRLGFFGREHLWRVDLPDGVPVEVGPGATVPLGGSWGDDGRIVYTPNFAEALWTIPEHGGKPSAFTRLDGAAGEVSHRWPCVLPGGAGVLFTIKSASDKSFDEASIAIADASTGTHRVLFKGGSKPRYLGDGRIVFMRGGRLYAVAFDLRSASLRGAPVPILEGVTSGSGSGNAWYDVSLGGDLVYLSGTEIGSRTRISLEGPGKAPTVLDGPEDVTGPILSSDLRRAVVCIGGANDKMGIIDMERRNLTRLTSGGGNDASGMLSKDGRFLLFGSDREGGGLRFYRMPLDASAPPAPLFEGEGLLHSISYGGGWLGFNLTSSGEGDAYIVAVSDDGTPKGKPILVAGGPGYQGTPAVSPDGTLVAWVSSESGRREVYAARLADPGTRRRLTQTGGDEPRGVVDVSFGDPEPVTRSAGADRIAGYDVSADGRSVVFAVADQTPSSSRDIRLWRGWGETVKAVR
jgi:tRNA A-37 threonylcarbamoyl transferase component Bud32